MIQSRGSGTVSRLKRKTSLRVRLFLAIFVVALVAIIAATVFSGLFASWRVRRFVEESPWWEQPAPSPEDGPYMLDVEPPMGKPEKPLLPRNFYWSFMLASVVALVLALVLSHLLALRISRPYSDFTTAVGRIAEGDYARQIHVKGGLEVEKLEDAFNNLASSLARTEELRKNMVADIAHELRNPLTTLTGNLELLMDGKIEYDRRAIESLLEEAGLLARTVEDLRQLALSDAGRLTMELAAVDVEDCVNQVLSRFKAEALKKKISLEARISPGVPFIKADRVRLAQVLGNLASNAMMHTREGGSIKVGADRSGNEVLFAVEDDGTGMTKEEASLVFERFHRTDYSRARATGGAGLGLSIARSLVELHGGRMWADSEPGEGTTVYFTVPVVQEELCEPGASS